MNAPCDRILGLLLLACALAGCALAGCAAAAGPGGTVDATADAAAGTAPDGDGPSADVPAAEDGGSCPAGAAVGADGACRAVGIQGCAPQFSGADGLCRPHGAGCPAGSIPRFTEGCVPVGVAACAPLFLRADGVCAPSVADCAPGLRPDPAAGCVPAGIPACAPGFVGADGVCAPHPALCAPGTLPVPAEGCVAAGIPGCAAPFLDADGVCRPEAARCAPGEIPVPAVGCVALDGPEGCGAPPWGAVPDAADTLYVDAAAAPAGDGSRGRPLAALADALAQAATGGQVVLAAGVYEGSFVVDRSLTLVGRCPSLVTLRGPDGKPALRLEGAATITVRGVRVEGSGQGVRVEAPAAAVLERVHVQGATVAGVVVSDEGAHAVLRRCLVEGTAEQDGVLGVGIAAQSGAVAEIEESAVRDNHEWGVTARYAGTRVTARGVVVEGTRRQTKLGQLGAGVIAYDGAALVFEGGALLGNAQAGAWVETADSVLELRESVIAANRLDDPVIYGGLGVHAQTGGRAVVRGCVLDDNRLAGVWVSHGGALELSRSLIQGTRPCAAVPGYGDGVRVQVGSSATLADVALVDNQATGVVVGDSEVAGAGVVIAGTRDTGLADPHGEGVAVGAGGSLGLTGSAVLDSASFGVWVAGEGAAATIAESLVAGTGTRPEHPARREVAGLVATDGAVLDVADSVVSGNRGFGVAYLAGAGGAVRGSLVRDTQPALPELGFGMGVLVSAAASADAVPTPAAPGAPAQTVSLEHSALVGNRAYGLSVDGGGVQVTATAVLIEGTRGQEMDGELGWGLTVSRGGALALAGSVVRDNREWNAVVAEAGSALATQGNVFLAGAGAGAAEVHPAVGGVFLRDGATADSTGDAFIDLVGAAIAARGAGTQGTFRGGLVRGVRTGAADGWGHPVFAGTGAALRLEDASVVDCDRFALSARDRGTRLDAVRVLAEGTRPDAEGRFGNGAIVGFEAEAVFDGCAFLDNHEVGLFTTDRAVVRVVDSLVSGTRPTAGGGELGLGLLVQGASACTVESSAFTDNAVSAVLAFFSTLDLTGCLVRGTREGRFFSDVSGERHEGVGDGVVAANHSVARLWDSRVADCARAGLLVVESGGELVGSEVTTNLVGLVAQSAPDFVVQPSSRIHGNREREIRYEGGFPIPEPLPLPEGFE